MVVLWVVERVDLMGKERVARSVLPTVVWMELQKVELWE